MTEQKTLKNNKFFQHGEILFHEKDKANSLFIVQKGSVRLFLKKGSGYIDLAMVKAGEVIGEMGYFDNQSLRRSCSASAVGETEVIEISYEGFKGIMSSLNPWINTIIKTLVERLKTSNDKVKKYESNSLGYKGGRSYKFFNLTEVIRILTTIYLVTNDRGSKVEDGHIIHLNDLNGFVFDIYNIKPAVYEEFLLLIQRLEMVEMRKDDDGLMKNLLVRDIDLFKQLTNFLESERLATEEKSVNISDKCEMLLDKILEQLNSGGSSEEKQVAKLTPIIKFFDEKKIALSEEDLADATEMGLAGEILINSDKETTAEINFTRLQKALPAIKLINSIKKANDQKSQ